MENVDKNFIDIEELRSSINLILDAIVNVQGKSIELKAEYYWTLNINQIFDMESEIDSNSLEIGSLSDDLVFLKVCKKEAVFNPAVFTHVTPLLNYLLAQEVKRLSKLSD